MSATNQNEMFGHFKASILELQVSEKPSQLLQVGSLLRLLDWWHNICIVYFNILSFQTWNVYHLLMSKPNMGKGLDMILSEYKSIIKFAMENEVEAQKFYEEAAQKVENTQLKEMFAGFAEEEKRHREILKQVYISNRMGDYFHEDRDYHIAEEVDLPELSTDMKPADAIALAMKKEAAAMAQYTALAETCPEPDKKKVFLDLASMERAHKLRMENAFVDIGFPEVW